MKRRIGILTGGGDCPGLNAVISTVVHVLVPRGVEVLGIEDAFSGLVDTNYHKPHGNVVLGSNEVRGIHARGGTILGTTNRGDPFRFVVRDAEGSETENDVSDRVLENARTLGLEGVISIGGDGSMAIAERFARRGLNVVGVPKTIDNDLGATDRTFGFDTAVGIAMEAIDRLRDTAESHDRVMLVEVMGRDAGFIALHAGIAGGADVILVPEIPYRIEPIATAIRRRKAEGQNYAIVVVAEGARPVDEGASRLEALPGGMPRLVGAARRIEDGLTALVPAEIRTTVLGHIQRGGSPSAYDRVLAIQYGAAAAENALEGRWGTMVALRNGEIVSVPLADAIRTPKRVAAGDALVRSARSAGVSFGDEG